MSTRLQTPLERLQAGAAIAACLAVGCLSGCDTDRRNTGTDSREMAHSAEPGRLAGGDVDTASYAVSGRKLFAQVCAMCHGPGGVGRPRLGKPLVNSEFIKNLDDDALLAFVKAGRNPGDPKNTTGIPMPPRGGNPALSDDDLLDIISYLRTLRTGAPAAATSN